MFDMTLFEEVAKTIKRNSIPVDDWVILKVEDERGVKTKVISNKLTESEIEDEAKKLAEG
jgi:hypothetical protein